MVAWLMCSPYTVEEVDEIGYADERQNPGIDLANNSTFHCFVVQIWYVR